jgi:hypothetical protein
MENALELYSGRKELAKPADSAVKEAFQEDGDGPSFNLDLELPIWLERPGYFETVLNLEVLEPAARTGRNKVNSDPLPQVGWGERATKGLILSQRPGLTSDSQDQTRKDLPFLPPVSVAAIHPSF